MVVHRSLRLAHPCLWIVRPEPRDRGHFPSETCCGVAVCELGVALHHSWIARLFHVESRCASGHHHPSWRPSQPHSAMAIGSEGLAAAQVASRLGHHRHHESDYDSAGAEIWGSCGLRRFYHRFWKRFGRFVVAAGAS